MLTHLLLSLSCLPLLLPLPLTQHEERRRALDELGFNWGDDSLYLYFQWAEVLIAFYSIRVSYGYACASPCTTVVCHCPYITDLYSRIPGPTPCRKSSLSCIVAKRFVRWLMGGLCATSCAQVSSSLVWLVTFHGVQLYILPNCMPGL